MKILIKHARIIAPGQPTNGLLFDLLIIDGMIRKVAENINTEADYEIAHNNLHVSPGWMDTFAQFWDPGFEYKEDLETGAFAAAAGGFTEVMVVPNTLPALDSRAQIEYICKKSHSLPVHVHPIGAISKGIGGKDLAEMYEMHRNGAIAFSDGLQPLQSSGLLLKALQYVKAFNGIIIQIPEDNGLSHNGLMHEGIWSTRLGVKGKPAIAEEVMIKRDLELLHYTHSRLHFTGISLKKSVDFIRKVKVAGLKMSCSVTPYHLLLTDECLQQYDSNFKVDPPLREQEDILALRQAVKEGIIDCIATHHIPQEKDSKEKEFEYAGEGMIGLESCFGLLGNAIPEMKAEQSVNLLAYKPRKIFNLPIPEIKEGVQANLTLFDPDMEWIFEEKDIRSKSKNSPFIGKTLKGKVFCVLNKNQVFPQ
jgi:dihydroorotase